jgi:hypothetical protein
VVPYRTPAANDDARLDALELAAFQARLGGRARQFRVWAGVLLTVICVAAPAVVIFALSFFVAPVPPPADTAPRCETHYVTPASGDPIPMTVCR